MRLSASRSLCKDKAGALMSFRLRSFPAGASMDPYVICHGNVIYQWCRAVWDGAPGLHIIQKVFEKASDDLWRSRRPWH
eukprot:666291-Pyramimonas_sp.AAC.1